MSKGKPASNATGTAEGNHALAGGFPTALGALAHPFAKPEVPADPLARMRAKFASHVDAAIASIQSGGEKGRWFRKLPMGGFVLTFRNANIALPLNGATHCQVADATSAIGLLEAAKAGVEAGELDEALQATRREPPVRKAKQAQGAAQS
jgi:hypothetical protein